MKVVQCICSYKSYGTFEVVITPDSCCPNETIYMLPPNALNLEDYAAPYKNKIAQLEKRYKYLERSRSWAVNNFRKLIG